MAVHALVEVAGSEPAPEERLLLAERDRTVAAALEALPDDAREVIVLYYLEESSVRQVAERLALSEAAVKQRLARGRAALGTASLAATLSLTASAFAAAVAATTATAVQTRASARWPTRVALAGMVVVLGVGVLVKSAPLRPSIGVVPVAVLPPSGAPVDLVDPQPAATALDRTPQFPEPVSEAYSALASVSERGWIRCDLTTAVTTPMEAPPLKYAQAVGTTAWAVVPQASGSTPLRPHRAVRRGAAPHSILHWEGAGPGQQGVCTVDEPRFVAVRAHVVDGEGNPVPMSTVRGGTGCEGGKATVDDSGLGFEALAGVPCHTLVSWESNGQLQSFEASFLVWEEGRVELLAEQHTTITVSKAAHAERRVDGMTRDVRLYEAIEQPISAPARMILEGILKVQEAEIDQMERMAE